jgi:hypothetical protein
MMIDAEAGFSGAARMAGRDASRGVETSIQSNANGAFGPPFFVSARRPMAFKALLVELSKPTLKTA